MMLGIEEILCELGGSCGGGGDSDQHGGLPPGFRFHPTDEELITFYLASKVFGSSFCGVDIAEVDLNRCEPWELPGTYIFQNTHLKVYFHLQSTYYLKGYFHLQTHKLRDTFTFKIHTLRYTFIFQTLT